jgi:phosphinothricin acetyltransferase
MIRDARDDDAAAVAAIYDRYVAETVITFEEEPVGAEGMLERMRGIRAKYAWIVAEEEGQVIGYAYYGPFRTRSAYRFSAESTVYLAPQAQGRGLGTALYQEIIARAKASGIHALIGGVALPNPASEALHAKLGFRRVATFEAVGFKFGRWIDVGFWELLL